MERSARGNKNIEGISALFDLGDAYYNYIDKQKLDGEIIWKTPSERARINLNLRDKFQLLNLIKKSYPDD